MRDEDVRTSCFAQLAILSAQFGADLPYRGGLDAGFSFWGARVPYLSPQKGIFRAAVQRGPAALSIQTSANTPPSVTITNPVNGAVFAAPANVTIQANASDTDGTVMNVQFFADTTLVGSGTAAPYSVIASNLVVGNYSIKAVAMDNGGLSSTSAIVNISVVTPVSVALSPPLITNGLFQFDYAANAGLRYVIENSSDLASWTPVKTNAASSSNEKFEEPFNVNLFRFYRVGRLSNP